MILVRVRDENPVKRTIQNRSIRRERCFTLVLGMQPRVNHQFFAVQFQEIRIRADLRLPGQINKSHSLRVRTKFAETSQVRRRL
jgi:hypothetical protein